MVSERNGREVRTSLCIGLCAHCYPSRRYIGDRQLMAYRFNLLDHQGLVSSFKDRPAPPYPHCFEFLGVPVNFEVSNCGHLCMFVSMS